jgi:DNA-binding transcriptional regulator LsrR (DeoR family)
MKQPEIARRLQLSQAKVSRLLKPATTPLDERVIGLGLDQLRRVPRSIAVAGGTRKAAAIKAALTGRLVTHLVTDRETAAMVVE